jgi:hypothetical protein
MKTLLAAVLFAVLAIFPVRALSTTLDELMSPTELANEFGLPESSQLIQDLLLGTSPLTPEDVQKKYGVNIIAEFPTVAVINTSEDGRTAQRLALYHHGARVGVYLTSTGREQQENPKQGNPYFSSTPTGWFSPQWFDRDHHSQRWDAPMEFAIFFNGGIAVHATTPDNYDQLGHRASGGCVRLTRENAETVWNAAFNQPPVRVPVFRRNGELALDSRKQVIRRTGNGVLFIVVNIKD